MRIDIEQTSAIIIDLQEKLMPSIDQKEDCIQNTATLIRGLNVLNIPYLLTQQYTKGLGNTVEPIQSVVRNENYFEKITFSAFGDEKIRKKLELYNKKNIIVCGTEAHVCVLQTVIDLCHAGYQVVLVENCIASRKAIDKKAALQRAIFEGAIITTHEAILLELVRTADHNSFKDILKIIK